MKNKQFRDLFHPLTDKEFRTALRRLDRAAKKTKKMVKENREQLNHVN